MTDDYVHGTGRAGWDDWRRYWSEVWKDRRADGIARRAERIAERLQDPPELPPWLADVLEECREEFTRYQFEALVLHYGYGLSLQEAADVYRPPILKTTFRKRLAGAQRKVDHLTGAFAARATALRREAVERFGEEVLNVDLSDDE